MKNALYIFPLLLAVMSCTVAPEPIHYGHDNCVECQMTIMDQRYGTEVVSGKGKVYKFDSIECLVEFLDKNENGDETFSYILFTSFDQPGKLVDASECQVLYSKNLPSPMGMYLTAFETLQAAEKFRTEFGGTLHSWSSLRENFDVIRLKSRSEHH